MPWIGPVISAGAGILGNIMSQSGQQETNAMNMAMMRENQEWQERMSDTQMQRRVTDLRAAGLNPMLAVNTPGAAMGSPVMPNLQNPEAAWGNLGNQVSSAAQLATLNAQREQMLAAANKMNVESGTEIPAQVQKIQSETGVNQQRATEIQKNISLLDFSIKTLPDVGVAREAATFNIEQGMAQNAIKTHIAQMDQQTQSDTLLSLIRARNDVNYATAIGAKNIYNASEGVFGRMMAYFNVPGVSNAVGVAKAVGSLAVP